MPINILLQNSKSTSDLKRSRRQDMADNIPISIPGVLCADPATGLNTSSNGRLLRRDFVSSAAYGQKFTSPKSVCSR